MVGLLSENTIRMMCGDIEDVFQQTCEDSPLERIFESQSFIRACNAAKAELGPLEETEVLREIISGYTNFLRKE